MLYVTSAFSLSMIPSEGAVIKVRPTSPEDARKLLVTQRWESAVGHEATAKILSEILGVTVPAQRKAIKLQIGDAVLVFQLLQRLPEGKILNEEELREVVESGNWRLFLVEVQSAAGQVKCHHCGYEWEYTGMLRLATCPSCGRKVKVREV